MAKRGAIALGLCCTVVTGCGGGMTDQQRAESLACTVVHGWPADFAELWPATLKNAVERGESAGQNMQTYIDGLKSIQDMNNPIVAQVLNDYGRYWILLEEDWRAAAQRGETSAPTYGPAWELLTKLHEQCAPYEDQYLDQ